MLKIVTAPNSVLTTATKKVDSIDQSILNLVKKMEKTLIAQVDPQGVGLAATQVGVGLSLFIMKPNKKAKTDVFINPKIVQILQTSEVSKSSGKKKKQPLEGCLSIPKIWSPVTRAKKVLLEYQDLTGTIHKKWFSGLKAIIVQHEVDHLQGILFTQRALEQGSQMYEEKNGKLKKLGSVT